MRKIEYIVIHCTATQPEATVESIKKYWREVLGWKSPGYHHLVEPNGTVNNLLPIEQVSNGVAGFNHACVNISYVGGIDKSGKPKDTRTGFQKAALVDQVRKYKRMFPGAIVQGHHDFPDVSKACPSFDAKTEYKNI